MAKGSLTLGLILVLLVAGCGSAGLPTSAATPTLPLLTTEPTPAPTAEPTPAATAAPTAEPTPAEPSGSGGATRSAAPSGSTAAGSPSPSPIDLSPYLTAAFTLLNLADDPVDVDVGIAGENGEVTSVAQFHLEPFDFLTERVPASTYQITWTRPAGGPAPVVCHLTLVDGDNVQFAVSAQQIAVAKDGYEPTSGSDLVVETSALCRQ